MEPSGNTNQYQSVHFHQSSTDPGCLVRGIWYVFVGWWLSAIMISIGWFLVVTILFLPLGLWFLHRVPWAQTLRPHTRQFQTTYASGSVMVTETGARQHPWYVRLLYVVLVGWWWGAIWLVIAWFLGVLIITLPLSIMMIDRSPGMVSLQRN